MSKVELYAQHKAIDSKGNYSSFRTELLEHKEEPLWWQEKGLQYTATGYGSKIPTRYKVKYNNRWLRVYCRIYSNSGTLYIISNGEQIQITEYNY